MAGVHSHGHAHGHAHGSARTARGRLAIAFGITLVIVLAQAVGSVITGSLALLTDTVHALADASGLAVALIAATMMLRPPSSARTWGFARTEVIAALGQAVLLLVVGLYTAVEGLSRLAAPPEVPSRELLIFGVVGLAANIVAILILSGSGSANLNLRAATLEVVNDALGSLGVIVAAVVIATTGFQRADALAGLFIAALIVPRAFRILHETLRILMEYTPRGVDLDEVREHILGLDHVVDLHDLHASAIGSDLPVISAHVVIEDGCFESGHAPQILADVQSCLRSHFPIAFEHSTIQLETEEIRRQEAWAALHE